ncbi:unnamed protein product [Ciceribacter selenitireducens ATCC BAA-1503]|uniref:Uncharacterized protein n=1 Tax=Ciceribacter selenitireducens ATCC BAA-1503 TaxID=1336235 RepID=A0A376AGU5_9HYPH|nr:unnamed protein product [Ciceribacter selenitireducens ATCC BAA-1503]
MTHGVLLEATFCGFLIRHPMRGGDGKECDPVTGDHAIQMGTLAFGFKSNRQPPRRPRDELNVNTGFRGGSRPGG